MVHIINIINVPLDAVFSSSQELIKVVIVIFKFGNFYFLKVSRE